MNYVLEINWKYFCWKRILRFQRISQKNCKVSGLEKIETHRYSSKFFRNGRNFSTWTLAIESRLSKFSPPERIQIPNPPEDSQKIFFTLPPPPPIFPFSISIGTHATWIDHSFRAIVFHRDNLIADSREHRFLSSDTLVLIRFRIELFTTSCCVRFKSTARHHGCE